MRVIVYRSDAVGAPTRRELFELCMSSARKNATLGITGFLVHHEGVFLQILEGDDEALGALYDRIRADERHRNVETLMDERTWSERNFGFWAMNVGPLDGDVFRREVLDATPPGAATLDTEATTGTFRERTGTLPHALDVLTRAYGHACLAHQMSPTVRNVILGSVPNLDLINDIERRM